VLPAVRGARPGLDTVLRAGDRRTVAGSGHVLRASLLVVEAALAVLLIVSAGLLVRSFIRLVNVDGGFDPSNVLVTQVYLPDADQRPARPSAFFERLVPASRKCRTSGRSAWRTWHRSARKPTGRHSSSRIQVPTARPGRRPRRAGW
jgi:hypothetical protein